MTDSFLQSYSHRLAHPGVSSPPIGPIQGHFPSSPSLFSVSPVAGALVQPAIDPFLERHEPRLPHSTVVPPSSRTPSTSPSSSPSHEIFELQRKNMELSVKLLTVYEENRLLHDENCSNCGLKHAYDLLIDTVQKQIGSASSSSPGPSPLERPILPQLFPADPKYRKTLFLWYQKSWNALYKQAKRETNILTIQSIQSDDDDEAKAKNSATVDNIPPPPHGFSTLALGNEKGSSRAANNINVMMRYIVDIDGNIVNGNTASQIRASPAGNSTRHLLESKFEELRYCYNNWKPQELAKQLYPAWHQNRDLTSTSRAVQVNEENIQQPVIPPPENERPPSPTWEPSQSLVSATEEQSDTLPNITGQDQVVEPPATQSTNGDEIDGQAGPHQDGGAEQRVDLQNLVVQNSLYLGVQPSFQEPPEDQDEQEEQAGGSTNQKYKNPDAIMKPSKNAKTARALCSVEWCKANVKGTVSQFDDYFKNLKKDNPVEYQATLGSTRSTFQDHSQAQGHQASIEYPPRLAYPDFSLGLNLKTLLKSTSPRLVVFQNCICGLISASMIHQNIMTPNPKSTLDFLLDDVPPKELDVPGDEDLAIEGDSVVLDSPKPASHETSVQPSHSPVHSAGSRVPSPAPWSPVPILSNSASMQLNLSPEPPTWIPKDLNLWDDPRRAAALALQAAYHAINDMAQPMAPDVANMLPLVADNLNHILYAAAHHWLHLLSSSDLQFQVACLVQICECMVRP
ncbi:hypothetical protein C8J56DRAFT_889072 [Mycena floridula]|nr:hypothetical protein C8J56DRAFT_889072 [Mycena floridula]